MLLHLPPSSLLKSACAVQGAAAAGGSTALLSAHDTARLQFARRLYAALPPLLWLSAPRLLAHTLLGLLHDEVGFCVLLRVRACCSVVRDLSTVARILPMMLALCAA
jgi:hypothetical protein